MSVDIKTPFSYGKHFLEIPVTSAKFYHEHLEEYSSMYLFGVDIMTTKGMHAKNVLNALTSLLKTPFIDRHHDSLISPVQLELFWVKSYI